MFQTFIDSKLADKSKATAVQAAIPYLEKCVEICWMMAIHDPPLHVDFSIKQGDKFDDKRYTSYSNSGSKVEFLVWPALYNGVGGGLLRKGVVATDRKVSKK